MAEDVLVIGAGPAGLASAYYLERAGISYKVVDKAQVIGSTWDSLYPSLRLNTTRFFSHMPEMKFPLRYGLFPTGRQYHDYLLRFAERHRFNIQLGVEVYRVAPEGELWRVESSEGVEHYPAVISATGRFCNPIKPDIPGLDTFTGTVIHAHDFRTPQDFAGKRVLVVGNGPSGVDISIDIGKVSPPVLLAIRSGITLSPRYPLGLPKHAWVMLAEKLPKRLGSWLEQKVEAVRYRRQEKFGLKLPRDKQPSSAVPYRGPELIWAVRDGIVKPVEAPLRFFGNCAELADGTQVQLDAVVLATGYQPVLCQYLDILFEADPQGWPLRGLSEHPNGREVLGHPGLYLVGVFYKGKGAMYNFNVEAEIAVEQIERRLANIHSKIEGKN
jgi:hypothetical protein